MKTWIEENQLITFFVLACSISWLIWFPLILQGLNWGDFFTPKWVHLLGAFGPMFSAIIITGIIVSRKYGPENFSPIPRQQI